MFISAPRAQGAPCPLDAYLGAIFCIRLELPWLMVPNGPKNFEQFLPLRGEIGLVVGLILPPPFGQFRQSVADRQKGGRRSRKVALHRQMLRGRAPKTTETKKNRVSGGTVRKIGFPLLKEDRNPECGAPWESSLKAGSTETPSRWTLRLGR
jgi:hypothetical protein